MKDPDIRWVQRFSNYCRALDQLAKAVELHSTRELSELEKQGLIQSFEYTHELSWNVLKDYLTYQGSADIRGSRDAFREGFSAGILADGEAWMETIKSRQVTVHSYNEDLVKDVAKKIVDTYYPLFVSLKEKLTPLLP